MILIFSQVFDHSTTDVCLWLTYKGNKFIRINVDDKPDIFEAASLNFSLRSKQLTINNSKIASVWFRSFPWVKHPSLKDSIHKSNKEIYSYIKSELESYQATIFNASPFLCKTLNTNYRDNSIDVNKVKALLYAESVGLEIPASMVATEKGELIQFSKQFKSIIIKSLGDNIFFHIDGNSYAIYTHKLLQNQINRFPKKIFPCLIQENIEKKIEVRSFFIENTIFSSAIFSQNNLKTKQDFRNYDLNNPNRILPYKLPSYIENKILNLAQKLNLNTGSIDMILGKDNKYYFLEVNPVGQFSMISIPCNYYLEESVASFLTTKYE